ncbi:MAG: hypothetical protein D6784_16010, partial [Chloroflexi bacterium]
MKPTTQKHHQPNTLSGGGTASTISTRRKRLLVWLGLVGLAVALNSLTACAGIIKVAPIPTPTITP